MFPSLKTQQYVINPTNSGRALDDGVEDRLHVRRRAADDAEHLGRCRLMLQRLAQFCVALAEFLEQPHVLDRDDGLVGEGFEQCDLLLCERTDLRVGEYESLRWRPPSRSKGYSECGSDANSQTDSRTSESSLRRSVLQSCICMIARSTTARPAGDCRVIGRASATSGTGP